MLRKIKIRKFRNKIPNPLKKILKQLPLKMLTRTLMSQLHMIKKKLIYQRNQKNHLTLLMMRDPKKMILKTQIFKPLLTPKNQKLETNQNQKQQKLKLKIQRSKQWRTLIRKNSSTWWILLPILGKMKTLLLRRLLPLRRLKLLLRRLKCTTKLSLKISSQACQASLKRTKKKLNHKKRPSLKQLI